MTSENRVQNFFPLKYSEGKWGEGEQQGAASWYITQKRAQATKLTNICYLMEGWDSLIRFLLFIIAELCCRRQNRLQGDPIQNVLNVIDSD